MKNIKSVIALTVKGKIAHIGKHIDVYLRLTAV